MSDVMLCGILRMPPKLALANDIVKMQHFSACQSAAKELEDRADKIFELEKRIKALEVIHDGKN